MLLLYDNDHLFSNYKVRCKLIRSYWVVFVIVAIVFRYLTCIVRIFVLKVKILAGHGKLKMLTRKIVLHYNFVKIS